LVIFCNTPPSIAIKSRTPTVSAIASSKWNNIVSVEYRKGTGKWQEAVPEGTLSSKQELFTAPPDATALKVVDESGLETVRAL
jgi:hypothetical protein